MEVKHDSTDRLVFKEAFLAVHNGNTDILKDLLPKLNDNIYISFFSGTKCPCGPELEIIASRLTSELFTLVEITDIIKRGICPHTTAEDKQLVSISLLHFACFYGQKEIVNLLIDRGANACSETSPSNCTPILMTIYSRNAEPVIVEIMSVLMDNGANPSQRDEKNDETLLHIAVRRGYLSVVELLLRHNCDIDAVTAVGLENQTALYLAIVLQRLDIVKVLVSHNADVNKGSRHDPVPLITAVRGGGYEFVKALLSTPLHNLDIDSRGQDSRHLDTDSRSFFFHLSTALHCAVYRGSHDIVALLLTHGADVNCVDLNGSTPLSTSLTFRDTQIFQEMIKFGADVNRCNGSGYGAIHRAAWDGKEEFVDILLQHGGCDHDTRTLDGNTPLALACHHDHKSIALKLMNLSVNVNNSDRDNDAPLHYSSYNGCIETCKRLVELGADPNVLNRVNITPLWTAVYGRSRSVTKFLIQLNVSMSVASSGYTARPLRGSCTDPHTPLHLAFDHCDDPYIAAMLIIAGVNLFEETWLRSTDLEVFNKGPGSAPHFDLLRCYRESPVSLRRLCRDEIRRRLATHLTDALPLFDLPASLTDYLLIKHDLQLCEAGTLDLLRYRFD